MPRGALSAGDLPRNIGDGRQDRQAVPRQVGASVKPVALQGVILLRCGVSDARPQRAISTYTLWIAGVSITDVSTNSSRRDATNFSFFVRAQGERVGGRSTSARRITIFVICAVVVLRGILRRHLDWFYGANIYGKVAASASAADARASWRRRDSRRASRQLAVFASLLRRDFASFWFLTLWERSTKSQCLLIALILDSLVDFCFSSIRALRVFRGAIHFCYLFIPKRTTCSEGGNQQVHLLDTSCLAPVCLLRIRMPCLATVNLRTRMLIWRLNFEYSTRNPRTFTGRGRIRVKICPCH